MTKFRDELKIELLKRSIKDKDIIEKLNKQYTQVSEEKANIEV